MSKYILYLEKRASLCFFFLIALGRFCNGQPIEMKLDTVYYTKSNSSHIFARFHLSNNSDEVILVSARYIEYLHTMMTFNEIDTSGYYSNIAITNPAFDIERYNSPDAIVDSWPAFEADHSPQVNLENTFLSGNKKIPFIALDTNRHYKCDRTLTLDAGKFFYKIAPRSTVVLHTILLVFEPFDRRVTNYLKAKSDAQLELRLNIRYETGNDPITKHQWILVTVPDNLKKNLL